jgi:hypothetical protein
MCASIDAEAGAKLPISKKEESLHNQYIAKKATTPHTPNMIHRQAVNNKSSKNLMINDSLPNILPKMVRRCSTWL